MGEGFTKKRRINFVSYIPPGGIVVDILEFFGIDHTIYYITLSHSVTKRAQLLAAARKYGKPDEMFHENEEYFWLNYNDISTEELDSIISNSRVEVHIEKLFLSVEALCNKLIREITIESTAKNDLLDI